MTQLPAPLKIIYFIGRTKVDNSTALPKKFY